MSNIFLKDESDGYLDELVKKIINVCNELSSVWIAGRETDGIIIYIENNKIKILTFIDPEYFAGYRGGLSYDDNIKFLKDFGIDPNVVEMDFKLFSEAYNNSSLWKFLYNSYTFYDPIGYIESLKEKLKKDETLKLNKDIDNSVMSKMFKKLDKYL